MTELEKEIQELRRRIAKLEEERIETNVYDIEELHENCTVQILKNSVTGETSIGWWEN